MILKFKLNLYINGKSTNPSKDNKINFYYTSYKFKSCLHLIFLNYIKKIFFFFTDTKGAKLRVSVRIELSFFSLY